MGPWGARSFGPSLGESVKAPRTLPRGENNGDVDEHRAGPRSRTFRFALKASLLYLTFGITWVLVSDRLVDVAFDGHLEDVLGTVKAMVFLLLSASAVFLAVRRYGRLSEETEAEIRASEERFRRSDQRYRSLVERVPGVVYLNEVDPDDETMTRCVYVGPQLEDLIGYTPQEWIDDPDLWLRVIHPDDRERIRASNEAADGRGEFRDEFRVIHRDGAISWIHDDGVRIRGRDGEPSYWQGLMVDITAQRVADAALVGVTESLRGVFTASPLPIVVLEREGNVRHWNPAAERLFGWTQAEVLGRPVPNVPEDERERYDATIARVLSGEVVEGVELERVGKDGRRIATQLSVAPFRDADGRIDAIVGMLEDVSDRRRVEEERRHALDRQLRLASRLELLHRVDRAVLAAGSIEEIGETALDHLRLLVPFDRVTMMLIDEATGVGTELVSRHSPEFGPVTLPSTPRQLSPQALRALSHDVLSVADIQTVPEESPELSWARARGIRSAVTLALRADGLQIGALAVSSMRVGAFDDEDLDILAEVASEIAIAISQTQLREAAAERARELERLAEERQQMLRRIVRAQEEERERVALEIHDGLGQVLTSISLFASDLEDEVPPASRNRASRVNELVRRAIGDSRQLVWSLRPPELERLGLVPALRRLTEEASTGELTVDLHEKIGDLRLTQEAEAVVYRVVQEAVHNAQKHASASAISILLRRRDGYVSTIVEDNGRGFDPAAVPHGSGLGLIGMRERAELVEGHLVIESADRAGTRVRLEVPVDAPDREEH